MREIMSTEVLEFKAVLKEWMDGNRLDILAIFRSPNGELVIHGGHAQPIGGSLIEDVLIEVDD